MHPSCGSFCMTLLRLTLFFRNGLAAKKILELSFLNSFAFLKFAYDIITEIKLCWISHGVRGYLNNNNNSNNKNVSLCLYLVNSLTDALFLKYWSMVLFALFQDFVMRGVRGILFLFRFCIWIKHQLIEFYLQLFYQTVRIKEKNAIEKGDFSTKL